MAAFIKKQEINPSYVNTNYSSNNSTLDRVLGYAKKGFSLALSGLLIYNLSGAPVFAEEDTAAKKASQTAQDTSKKVDSKQKTPQAGKDTTTVEDIISGPKVLHKATGKEAKYFTRKGEKVSYVEILANGNAVGYDAKDKEVFNREMSRNDQFSYNRLIKKIKPKYNEVVNILPKEHVKHFSKKAYSAQIVDGVCLKTFNKKGKLIKQEILTPEKLEKLGYSEYKEGKDAIIKMGVEAPEGFKVRYSGGLLDSTGRKVITHKDAGFYVEKVEASADNFKTIAKSMTYYIAIKDSNFAPERIDTIKTVTVVEGDTAVVKPEFKDKDGDKVEVGLKAAPDKCVFLGEDGSFILRPMYSAVSKGTLDVALEGFATDLKDSIPYLIAVKLVDKNLKAQIVGLDSVNDFGVMEGDTSVMPFYFIDLDSADVKAKGAKIIYPGDTTKQEVKGEAKKDTSFDAFIEDLLSKDKDKKKEDVPALEDLADPSKYIVLVKKGGSKYELQITPPENAVPEKDTTAKELELIIMYHDGKEAYEVAKVNASIYNKAVKKEEISFSLGGKSKEDLAKEEKEKKEKAEKKEKLGKGKKARKASLQDGSYDASKRFDKIDYFIAKEFVDTFAVQYKNEKYSQILGQLKTTEPLLAKKDGSRFSHYRNLKRICDEMQKFKGYDTVAANIPKIHELAMKKDKMRVSDYKRAQRLIKKSRRTINNNNLDKNPKCEGLIGDLNLQEKIIKGKKPGKLRQIGYNIASVRDIVNPNEWRNHPKETFIKLSAAGGTVALGVLGYNTIGDIRAERRLEQGRQDDRNIASSNPDDLGQGRGSSSGSFTDSTGNSNITEIETDTTGSDTCDNQQRRYKRKAERDVKFSNKEAAIRNGDVSISDAIRKVRAELKSVPLNVDVPHLIKNKEFRIQFNYTF